MQDEELAIFLEECREHLESIESRLLTLEGSGSDAETINAIFRAAHSIKGGAGFFGLDAIKGLAHHLENVLDQLRQGWIEVGPDLISVLLEGFDVLAYLVGQGSDSNSVNTQEIERSIQALAKENPLSKLENTTQATKPKPVCPVDSAHVILSLGDHLERAKHKWIYLILYVASVDAVDDPLSCVGEILGKVWVDPQVETRELHAVASVLEPDLMEVMAQQLGVEAYYLFRDSSGTDHLKKEPQIQESVEPKQDKKVPNQESSTEGSLRIPVVILENMMNLASELVLARNQLAEAVHRGDLRLVQTSSQRISQVTSELQEAVMQTRMQPLGNLFQRFPRIVRELSKMLGKEITLTLEGKDVEVDKTIIEGLADPLTHMVRNALDHGLETPSDRVVHGKSPMGTIVLTARHEAGQVIVELKDDGRGIRGDKIAEKAIEKGLIDRETVRRMSNEELVHLIFLPGLSTAEEVSELSGRGVGMDVVKSNIDQLGGKIEIETVLGEGTVFRIRLPLTLAIIPSLLVGCRGERFAIPQTNVDELVRVHPSQIQVRVQNLGGVDVLDLRGELLPLAQLGDLLKIAPIQLKTADGKLSQDRRRRIADRRQSQGGVEGDQDRRSKERRGENSAMQVVIVNTGSVRYGLMVDELFDTLEIVVKPLESWAQKCSEYAGATIMGDGRVALILDIPTLAVRANVVQSTDKARKAHQGQVQSAKSEEDEKVWLTFEYGTSESCAVPLLDVARIETVQLNQLEEHRGVMCMRYQGKMLPLVDLSNFGMESICMDRDLVVLVLEKDGEELGLLAQKPLDVGLEMQDVDWVTLSSKHFYGSATMGAKTRMLLNLDSVWDDAKQNRIQSFKQTGETHVS